MKTNTVFFFSFLFFLVHLSAQKLTFLKQYNTDLWSVDKGWALEADKEGYTIGTGSFCQNPKNCFKIIRTDLEGTEQWTSVFYQSPPNSIRLAPNCVIQTQDGNFIVAGDRGLPTGENEVFLYKVNAQGDSLWMRFYESPATDFARNLFEFPNGDLLLHVDGDQKGVTTGRKGLMKTDKEGNIIWRHDYLQDTFYNNQQGNLTRLSTGEFLMTYWSSHTKHLDEFKQITKLDKEGNILWSKVYGFVQRYSDMKIVELKNGNYLQMSSIYFYNKATVDPGPCTIPLTVLDTAGTIIWQKIMYISAALSYFTDMELTPEGDIVLIGMKNVEDNPVYQRPWVLKLAPSLDIIWEKLIDLPERKGQERFSLSDLVITPSGNLAISCTIQDPKVIQGLHAALLVLDSNGCITTTCDSLQFITEVADIENSPPQQAMLRVFPNPTMGQTQLHFEEAVRGKIQVKNLLGTSIFQTDLLDYTNDYRLELTNFPSGVYYVSVTDERHRVYTKKIIKLF